jgi:hypothetical protein
MSSGSPVNCHSSRQGDLSKLRNLQLRGPYLVDQDQVREKRRKAPQPAGLGELLMAINGDATAQPKDVP